MQNRCPLVGQFLVNGNKCEVSIDDLSISWAPIKSGPNGNSVSLDFGLSVDSQASAGKSYIVNSASSASGSSKRTRHDNGTKRVELDRVIGYRRWPPIAPPNEEEQEQAAAQSKHRQSLLAASFSHRRHRTLSTDSARRPNRIKLYYSKQISSKTSVAVAQFHQIPAHHHQQQQQQQQHRYSQEQPLETRTPTRALNSATTTTTPTPAPLDELALRLEELLALKRQTRPQRLLVFVNPYGGKGRALRLYKSQVRRLLELAGIETKLVVTSYQNHARETIEDPSFNVEYFDGVVCVGGDGMFAELMNGLLFRYNRDKISAAQLSQLAASCKLANDDDDHHEADDHPSQQRRQTQTIGGAELLPPASLSGGGGDGGKRDSSNGTSSSSGSGDSGFAAGGGNSGGELSETDDLDNQPQMHNGTAKLRTTTTAATINETMTATQVATSGGGGGDQINGHGDKLYRRHDNSIGPLATNASVDSEAIEQAERLSKSASDNILLVNTTNTTNNNNNNNNNSNQDVSFSENYTLSEQRLIEYRSALGGIGQQFNSPPIPVGVIGAGSTDANSFGFIGTNDVITATLNIILGNQIKIDVCSVHTVRDDRVLRFVSTFVAYGYFGDVIRESERLRWLGPSRYDVTGLNNLIKNRAYKGRVEILTSSQDGTPNNNLERCHSKCEQCSVNENDTLNSSSSSSSINHNSKQQPAAAAGKKGREPEFRFIEIQGSFIGVNAAVTACRCPKTKKGFSPSNHLANGCADLILVRPCTRLQYLHYLLRIGWTKKSAFDLKYVEAYRCRQFEFVALSPSAKANSISSNSVLTTGSCATSNKTSSSLSSSLSSSSQQQPISRTKTTVGLGSNTIDSSLGPLSLASSSDLSVGRSSNSNSLDSEQSNKLKGSIGSTFSSWNVDGEILNEQSIRVKVNNKLMRVFGTGEPTESK